MAKRQISSVERLLQVQRNRRQFLVVSGSGLLLARCSSAQQSGADVREFPRDGQVGETAPPLPPRMDAADVALPRPDMAVPMDAATPDAAVPDAVSRLDGAVDAAPGVDAGSDAATFPHDSGLATDGTSVTAPSDGAPASLDTHVAPADAQVVLVDGGVDAITGADVVVATDASSPAATGDLVLEFTGDNQHVNHGNFFPQGVPLGNTFFWDAWVRASDVVKNAAVGYIVSDGYGGAHGLLWGFQGGGGTAGSPAGNVYLTDRGVPFGGDADVSLGAWVHVAVAADGAAIRTYVNGVCTGTSPFTGVRRTPNPNSGGLALLVGGSEHLNFHGRIAWLRAWDDDQSPLTDPEIAFVPDRRPSVKFGPNSNAPACQFLADYTYPQWIVRDLSPQGCRGGRHPGVLFNASRGVNQSGGYNGIPDTLPLPRWTKDTTCPVFWDTDPPAPNETPRVASRPVDIGYVWDSFARPDQTYAYKAAPTLGKTEAGAVEPQAWRVPVSSNPKKPSTWGMISGSAVYLGDTDPGIAWIDAGVSTCKISVTRLRSAWNPGRTGIAFRVKDDKNYRAVIANGDGTFSMHRVEGGVSLPMQGETAKTFPLPNENWNGLSVLCQGPKITVQIDGVPVKAFDGQTSHEDATGCGLASPASSLARWLNFHAEPIK